ncbi:MAG: hypothetical protein AB7R90_13155 [Reyranellaceae bacterium]
MLTRRHLLAALPLLPVFGRETLAAVQCSRPNEAGMQFCEAGLQIGPVQTARQRCDNWCWAACVQIVFALRGFEVEQEEIVRKIYGSTACLRANGLQILQAITGNWVDSRGRRFRATGESLPDAGVGIRSSGGGRESQDLVIDMTMKIWSNNGSAELVQELANGHPLIIGALGHATVLTAARYERAPSGFVTLRELVVRDPWPDNFNRRVLRPEEARGNFFVVKVSVAA